MKILVFLALSLAITLAKPVNILPSLAEIDKDPVGNSLMSLVALHMKAQTPIAEIGTLLDEMLLMVQGEKSQADTDLAAKEESCGSDILANEEAI